MTDGDWINWWSSNSSPKAQRKLLNRLLLIVFKDLCIKVLDTYRQRIVDLDCKVSVGFLILS